MAMSRRSFAKMLGVAGASLLVSLGLQNSGVARVKAEKSLIPGAGRSLTAEDIEKIDSDAFVGLCARCGICANVCPHKVIKFKEIFYPTLTKTNREICPGYDICGLCLANCPPDALSMAFKPVGKTSGSEKSQLWNGQTLKSERLVIGENR
ncbi:MAG: 4Fe-4S dicluster domain-containing protein [Thermoplasmata archaeon]